MSRKRKTFNRASKAQDQYAYRLGWENCNECADLDDYFKRSPTDGNRVYRGFLGTDNDRWTAARSSFKQGRSDSLLELAYL